MTATPTTAENKFRIGPDAIIMPGKLPAGLVFLGLAVILLYEAVATPPSSPRAVMWGGLALTALAAGLMCVLRLGHDSSLGLARWSFGAWTLLWYGVAFGLASLTWIQPQSGPSAEIAISSVVHALWLVAVGMVMWALGYCVGPGNSLRAPARRVVVSLRNRFSADVRSPAAPWALYGVGVTARLATIVATGRFGYIGDPAAAVGSASGYDQLLKILSLCAPLAVAAAALQVFRQGSRSARITLVCLFISELFFGVAAGGKQSFIVTVLAVIIPFCATRRKLPPVAVVAAIAAFIFVIIPFNQAYRGAARGESGTLTPRQAIASAPAIFRRTVLDQNPAHVLYSSTDYLLQRIREIDSPAIVMQRTPRQISFLSPASLIAAPAAALVPRALWPGKPILATGYKFTQTYYEMPPTLYSSSAITPVADLFRHGGWIPVVAGMFVLGCGVRLIDDVLDVRANPHAVFLVLLLFPALVKAEAGWVMLLAGIPGTLLLWLLTVRLSFRRRRAA